MMLLHSNKKLQICSRKCSGNRSSLLRHQQNLPTCLMSYFSHFFDIPLWLGLFNGFDVRELYKLYVAEQNCHSTDYSFQESFLHMLNLLINFKLLS